MANTAKRGIAPEPPSPGAGGFSLVEMMIAMATGSMVIIAIYTAFNMQQASHLLQEKIVVLQQSERMALDSLALDLRLAGYDPTHDAGAGFTAATSTAMTVTMDIRGADASTDGLDNNGDGQVDELGEANTTDGIDNDGDGQIDEVNEEDADGAIASVGEIIAYDLFLDPVDGVRKLRRQTINPANPADPTYQPETVAENVERIEFLYLLDDGSMTLAPAAADLSRIRGVYLSVLTALLDPDFRNSSLYDPASVVKGVAAATWGPFNDNFRRRMLTRLVLCRNMGLN